MGRIAESLWEDGMIDLPENLDLRGWEGICRANAINEEA